jgi:hypothetical protein
VPELATQVAINNGSADFNADQAQYSPVIFPGENLLIAE